MHPLEKRVLLPQNLEVINSLEEYKAQGGLKALERARTMKPLEILGEVKKANLRGRGGAGFPAALKWQTVLDDDSPKKYVVCNFAEGEPGTYKDRYLISKNPYIVFEGLLIIAQVINAKEAIICTKEKFKPIVKKIKHALEELEAAGVVEKGYVRIVLGPDDYLLGEEKALLEVVDGRPAMPRLVPPFMFGVGFSTTENNPTIVNNVETMSQVVRIMTMGADEWKKNGFEDTPGTMIITLSGDLKNPGMYEIPLGLTVRQLFYEIGGGPKDGRQFKAVLSGFSNRIMTPDQFDLQLGFGTLRNQGIGLGSGGFIIYDDSRSMVDIAWIVSHFLAVSSCGQCVPCNSGTKRITEWLVKIRNGEGTQADFDSIMHETTICTNQTRCFLPTQESVVIPSIMKKFKNEFENYSQLMNKFDHNIVIPKIQDFDETAHQFIYEENPKEFA